MDKQLVLEIARKLSEGMSYQTVKEVYGFTSEQMQELKENMIHLTLEMSSQLNAEQQKQALQAFVPQVQQMLDENPNMSEETRNILEEMLALIKYED